MLTHMNELVYRHYQPLPDPGTTDNLADAVLFLT